MSAEFKFAIKLARDAGSLILNASKAGNLTLELKNNVELVTSADNAADSLICEQIRSKFPGHVVISEESSPDASSILTSTSPFWIVDPIDGTVNFAHGLSQSAVSIAFVENGVIEIGVVFNPFTNELFAARRGQGATLNGLKIAPSAQIHLRQALIATGFPYQKTDLRPILSRLEAVLNGCADIRRLGSAALDICFVATGRLDGYYESLSLWDFAAAQLIAKEAGAVYGSFGDLAHDVNEQFNTENILVTNPFIFNDLKSLLRIADGLVD